MGLTANWEAVHPTAGKAPDGPRCACAGPRAKWVTWAVRVTGWPETAVVLRRGHVCATKIFRLKAHGGIIRLGRSQSHRDLWRLQGQEGVSLSSSESRRPERPRRLAGRARPTDTYIFVFSLSP